MAIEEEEVIEVTSEDVEVEEMVEVHKVDQEGEMEVIRIEISGKIQEEIKGMDQDLRGVEFNATTVKNMGIKKHIARRSKNMNRKMLTTQRAVRRRIGCSWYFPCQLRMPVMCGTLTVDVQIICQVQESSSLSLMSLRREE